MISTDECTDEQLVWMSEVFEEIVHVIQSVAFLDSLKNRVTKSVEKSKKPVIAMKFKKKLNLR